MPYLLTINDRHIITAAEAAYTGGLCKTFFPVRNPIAAQTAERYTDQPVLWYVYHVAVKILNSADAYKEGVYVEIAQPNPMDTGSMPLVQALQSGGLRFAQQSWAQGLPVCYGLRWRVWDGAIAENDLVIFRATYTAGVRL